MMGAIAILCRYSIIPELCRTSSNTMLRAERDKGARPRVSAVSPYGRLAVAYRGLCDQVDNQYTDRQKEMKSSGEI